MTTLRLVLARSDGGIPRLLIAPAGRTMGTKNVGWI
jgi:hypothetical protein